MKRLFIALTAFTLVASSGAAIAQSAPAPMPLVSEGHPAQWIFAYKLNASAFPTPLNDPGRACPFGGTPRMGTGGGEGLGQQYLVASSDRPRLRMGSGLIGSSLQDPLGATFSQIYNGNYSYVVWNDQFQGHPMRDRSGSWGHSKGIIAWNQNGDGIVLQVTTPAWPGSGSDHHRRQGEGNTLGCIGGRNNMTNAQHFFALALSRSDVARVLEALENASVVTNVRNDTIVNVAAEPSELRIIAMRLGIQHRGTEVTDVVLSSGVRLLSKPSRLRVPPWQLVSAMLTAPGAPNGPALRVATWSGSPLIPDTTQPGDPGCWGFRLHPGPVASAGRGTWGGREFGLAMGSNHAKIGVSTDGSAFYAIFGDLNQQGSLTPADRRCSSSQNGRGGLFFVIDNRDLHDCVAELIADVAPASAVATRTCDPGPSHNPDFDGSAVARRLADRQHE